MLLKHSFLTATLSILFPACRTGGGAKPPASRSPLPGTLRLLSVTGQAGQRDLGVASSFPEGLMLEVFPSRELALLFLTCSLGLCRPFRVDSPWAGNL